MVRSKVMFAFLGAALIACTIAAPAPEPNPDPALDDRPEIIEIIAPAASAQETLDSLNLGEPGSEQSERNKRTIGILRQLFPTLTQIIEQKIQMLTSQVFQLVGPALLRGVLGGGNQAGDKSGTGGGGTGSIDLSEEDEEDSSSSNSASRISIDLPTLSPGSIEDDDDETKDVETFAIKDSDSAPSPAKTVSLESRTGDEVKSENIEESNNKDDVKTISEDTESLKETKTEKDLAEEKVESTAEEEKEDSLSNTETKVEATAEEEKEDLSATTETTVEPKDKDNESTTSNEIESETNEETSDSKNLIRKKRYLGTSGLNADENQLISGAESQQSEVRVQFADEAQDKSDDDASSDQQTAAQTNSAQIDELTLDDTDINDENRNKRFLNFGLGGSGGSGGSGGGSGNFLFDIIRRPAESMARAAGTAFRVLTGTDSIDLGITATSTATRDALPPLQLVAGSGGTEQTDENAAAADGTGADGAGVAKGDGYTEGIPGPITRLFIIANRGIANLIQDLILRLAQTSERIVNFKARLITSII